MNADIYSRFTAGRLSAVQATIADHVYSGLEEWVKDRPGWVVHVVGSYEAMTIDLSFRQLDNRTKCIEQHLVSALYMSADQIGVMLFRHTVRTEPMHHPEPHSYFDVQVDELVPLMVKGL